MSRKALLSHPIGMSFLASGGAHLAARPIKRACGIDRALQSHAAAVLRYPGHKRRTAPANENSTSPISAAESGSALRDRSHGE